MNGRKTLVEEGTQFKGSLTSDCPIEVKGRVEGDTDDGSNRMKKWFWNYRANSISCGSSHIPR